jgi:hypothetical protein
MSSCSPGTAAPARARCDVPATDVAVRDAVDFDELLGYAKSCVQRSFAAKAAGNHRAADAYLASMRDFLDLANRFLDLQQAELEREERAGAFALVVDGICQGKRVRIPPGASPGTERMLALAHIAARRRQARATVSAPRTGRTTTSMPRTARSSARATARPHRSRPTQRRGGSTSSSDSDGGSSDGGGGEPPPAAGRSGEARRPRLTAAADDPPDWSEARSANAGAFCKWLADNRLLDRLRAGPYKRRLFDWERKPGARIDFWTVDRALNSLSRLPSEITASEGVWLRESSRATRGTTVPTTESVAA